MENRFLTLWKEEDLHSAEQIKRCEKAYKSDTAPSSIDVDDFSAIFDGDHGTYHTTLNHCSCIDFSRRKKPCKHIFRLAIELGLYGEKEKCSSKTLSLESIVVNIEKLPDSSQLIYKDFILLVVFNGIDPAGMIVPNNVLKQLVDLNLVLIVNDDYARLKAYGRNFLRDTLLKNGISNFKKNMSQLDLVDWIVKNIDNTRNLFPDSVALTLPEPLRRKIRKAYIYLRRKYDNDCYMDENLNPTYYPWGAEILFNNGKCEYVFPDDEVTFLLEKYGYNRCASISRNESGDK